ncbi:MAG: glycosyl transferase [Clostridiales bacterium]|nr:glycosyl transferase [Clostridiales bacterium]
MNRLKDCIMNPRKIIIAICNRWLHWMPDEQYLKIKYYINFGKKLDISNPQTFNEKLQWLKIHDRNPLYTVLVDKYAVRKYIKEKLGEEYLIPLVGGPWKNANDINFDKLPDQFVLKCTHDSGGIIICRDKESLNRKAAVKKLNKALKKNFYYGNREWVYKNVKRQIIAEKYMQNDLSDELIDYKLMCFNSQVKCSFTCTERRKSSGLKVTFFDTDWKRLPFERHYPASSEEIKKPKNYEEMIRIAENLSVGMSFVRIDFYEIHGKIYFGEFTFYPGSGSEEFSPDSWDLELGNWIKIPEDMFS